MDDTTPSPIELYFLTCKHELSEITEQHNNLICRISGISDPILQEQLSEEYVMIEEQLSTAQAKFNEAEKLLVESLISDWYGDYLEFYRKQFIENNPIRCIEKTNHIEISALIERMRLRIPTSMKNKRELHLIAITLKKKIRLLSFDGTEIDTMGSDSSDTLNLYVNEKGDSVIPKAIV